MDFEAEEVVRLREEILRFVLQQLKETAQTGELRKASEELAGPIGAAVEDAVQRAMARGGGGAATARIGDLEINRIARAVAGQLGGKGRAPAAEAPSDGEGGGEDQAADYYSGAERHQRKPRWSLEQLIGLGLALLVGIAIGIGAARFMDQPDTALVGSEATQVVNEPEIFATSDSQLDQVEAPPRPAPSAAPQQGSQPTSQ